MSSGPGPEDPDRPDHSAAGEDRPDLLGRLDPERARSTRRPSSVTLASASSVDPRRYRWIIGIFGLFLVVVVSVYQFATHGVGTTGVPPGQRLHYFAAPLANSNLVGDANLAPPCTLARHDPRALNICLLAQRGPLVLSFFVTGSGQCEHQVDALQRLAARFSRSGVQFAAVAINADRPTTDALIRSHHWTIPVAYDLDGSVGALYGVAVCPMAELAQRGGIVRDRLIGTRWQSAQVLAPRIQALITASGRAG
ncbi:MAG: TlpA disulfide reductase family protein [Solirubrobacteraceae bacterium]